MRNFIFCVLIFFSINARSALQGKVVQIFGQAHKNTLNENLKLGDLLKEGDQIQTYEKSRIRILLNNDIAIQLGPNSKITLTEEKEGPVIIQLIKGALYSRIKPQVKKANEERYQVKTSLTSIGVRGTTFFVSYEDKDKVFICDCMGEILLKWKNGSRRFKTRHHDDPVWVDVHKKELIHTKDAVHHSDEDMSELGKIIGILK